MIDTGEAIRKLTLNLARYSGIAPLTRPFFGGVGAILMLHRVTAQPIPPNSVNRHLTVDPAFLDELIADMKRSGYVFLSLDEVCERLAVGDFRQRFATITADDGYRDNLIEALPVFEKHSTPFTIYVAPALINRAVDLWWMVAENVVDARDVLRVPTALGTATLDCSTPARKFEANSWLHTFLTTAVREEDQRQVLRDLARSVGVDPEAPARETLMNWDELRRIAAHPLATIGAHSVNHYSLSRLPESKAAREIADCAGILEIEIGARPRHMAYPYGYAGAAGCREVALAAKAGFVSAVTTRHGVLQSAHSGHMHALPRISVNGRYQRIGHMRTMLSGVTTPLANAGKMVVTV
ncbi:MAG: polysaccharide deacetylase family protein [Rhizobiaceae bacterium]